MNFKIEIELAVPMIMGKYSLSLDSLLASALFRKTGDTEEAVLQIPLKKTKNIFHGSVLFFSKSKNQPLVQTEVPYIGGLRPEVDLHPSKFAPTSRGSKYKRVNLAGGVEKVRLDQYKGYLPKRLTFFGSGDGEKALLLIKQFIPGIGAKTNTGAGEIRSVQMVEVATDMSLMNSDQMPQRPIPWDVWVAINGSKNARKDFVSFCPPYWKTNQVECAVPDRLNFC